jgi:adenylate cyclase
MADEIERKFVLDGLPESLDDARSRPVAQGYLAVGDDEVRVRRIGDSTVLTVKRGSGERRTEEEVEISDEAFEALWPLTQGRRVRKRRFELDRDGYRIEVDVYEDALEGLVTAEIEFDSERESAAFDPGDLGREVTGDARYSNQRLAIDGAPKE